MDTSTSFAEAYGTYWARAARVAGAVSHDRAAAEDIAAEGLLRVWRHWDAGRVLNPWGYIRRTVVNESISRARTLGRQQRARGEVVRTSEGGPEDGVADRDLVARLLAELPPRQRRILELRYLLDLSEREAAQQLGISVGAVKSGASRGLARLRAAHGQDSDGR